MAKESLYTMSFICPGYSWITKQTHTLISGPYTAFPFPISYKLGEGRDSTRFYFHCIAKAQHNTWHIVGAQWVTVEWNQREWTFHSPFHCPHPWNVERGCGVSERRGIGSRESAEIHRNAPLVAEAELWRKLCLQLAPSWVRNSVGAELLGDSIWLWQTRQLASEETGTSVWISPFTQTSKSMKFWEWGKRKKW